MKPDKKDVQMAYATLIFVLVFGVFLVCLLDWLFY